MIIWFVKLLFSYLESLICIKWCLVFVVGGICRLNNVFMWFGWYIGVRLFDIYLYVFKSCMDIWFLVLMFDKMIDWYVRGLYC